MSHNNFASLDLNTLSLVTGGNATQGAAQGPAVELPGEAVPQDLVQGTFREINKRGAKLNGNGLLELPWSGKVFCTPDGTRCSSVKD